LQKKGVKVHGPFPGSRKTKDGETLRWSLAFPEIETSQMPLPFLIDWGQSDKERLEALKQQNMLPPHEERWQITQVGFLVQHMTKTTEILSELFDLKRERPLFDTELEMSYQKLSLPGCDLVFYEPGSSGDGSRMLSETGDRPFLVDLTHTGQETTINMLNARW